MCSVALTNTLLPVLTLIIGFLGSYLLELRREDRSARREHSIRAVERREVAEREAIAYERQVLLDARAAVHELVEAVHGLILGPVGRSAAAGLNWQDVDGADALRAAILAANVRCGHRAVAMVSRQIATAVDRVTSAAVPIYMTKDSAWEETIRVEFYAAVDQALGMTAARLAELYGIQNPASVEQLTPAVTRTF